MSLSKITKSLDDLTRKITKTTALVEKGDKMTISDTIKVSRKSNSITSTIKKGIKNYQEFNPTPTEAQTIMKKMELIVDLTEKQLDVLVKNKAQFDKLHVGGMVKKNLTKTKTVSAELSVIMTSKAPSDMKPEADALDKRQAAAFEKTMAVFAGMTGGEDRADEEEEESDN